MLGLRLCARYPKKVSGQHHEVLAPAFELDPAKYEIIDEDRFAWLEKHPVGHWAPFIVPAGGAIVKRLVFETRWDNPIAPDLMSLSLEIFTIAKKHWTKVNQWEIPLTVEEWAFFTGHNGGTRYPPQSNVLVWHEQVPENLHDPIIYRGPIPASWADGMEPSFLAYEGEEPVPDSNHST